MFNKKYLVRQESIYALSASYSYIVLHRTLNLINVNTSVQFDEGARQSLVKTDIILCKTSPDNVENTTYV